MTKILIAGILPLEGSSSGEYCLDLAYWLYNQGYEVEILTTANGKTTIHNNIRNSLNFKEKYNPIEITDILFPIQGIKDFPAFAPHNLQGFKIYFRDMKMADVKIYLEILKDALKESINRSKPDIIICNHITPLAGLLAEIQEELGIDIPVIQIGHNEALKVKTMKFKQKEARDFFADKDVFDRLFVDLFEKGKKLVKTTISVSDLAHEQLKESGFTEKEIYKRFKGFDPETFKPIKTEIDTWNLVKLTERGLFQDINDHLLTACCAEYRKNFGYDYLGGLHDVFSKEYIFVFAGRLTAIENGLDQKGVDILIDATKILNEKRQDVGIIVCGNGSNHSKLISMAYDNGLDNMFFVGEQDHSTVIPLWNSFAQAGIYPSRVEPLGMVAIECAASGTPPITSTAGGFKDFVQNIGGEALAKCTPEKLAEAMNKAIEEDWKEKRQEKFKNAAKFSWAKISKEIDKKAIKPYVKFTPRPVKAKPVEEVGEE